jgi:murein DD-endopeptidase MepM/ murein hydrolase activator NlpD
MGIRTGQGRFFRTLVALVVGCLLLWQAAPQARAGAQDDLNKLQQQLDEISREKAKTTNELQRLEVEAEEAEAQRKLAEQELAVANSQLSVVQADLAATNNELKKVQADLTVTQKRYDQRKALLGIRIRAIQEEGRVNYLGVLFGASSFADFISRFDVLKMVVTQDSKLFGEVRKDKKELEEKKVVVEDRKSHLLVLQAQEKERVATVEVKRNQREVVSRSLDTRKRSLAAQLDAFERESDAVYQQVWQIQQAQGRAGGKFSPIYPVKNYTITDTFGPRLHPILGVWKTHYGTDFAATYGTPVLAIEAGVVIMAGWNDAYGNLVVIDHGGGIASWYGHSSKLLVSVGDKVKQGQQISNAGSTGWSTGPHVHLEIHVNGTPVDPMTYLP